MSTPANAQDREGFEPDAYDGRCAVCGRFQRFVRRARAIRETYACPGCRSSARYRHQAQALVERLGCGLADSLAELAALPGFRGKAIYEPGIAGPFRRAFQELEGYVHSFYWEDVAPGAYRDGVRCEDLMALTFADASFDLVLTSDVFEHIRHPFRAFAEIRRVLKPGGLHVFSIPPMAPLPRETRFRVETSTERDVPLLPERYHGDGRGGRSLVYTDFGADLLDALAEMGLPTRALRMEPEHPRVGKVLTFVSEKAPRGAEGTPERRENQGKG